MVAKYKSIAVQILLDVFDIEGVVHYGTAGSSNDSLSLGDVSVMKYVAFTSPWKWKVSINKEDNEYKSSFKADIYLDNAAYREFLFKELNVSIVDEESASTVMTCLSNGLPYIVFRRNFRFGWWGRKAIVPSLSSPVSINALSVAVEFIALLDKENTIHDHQKGVSFSAF
ncbi:uncharacterized protein LOC123208524 [Mangifera indica]|uniref:uncharacterized protein LOC123208524 n=1 Tax=Mangifera indica TaxID=29780 RepID=UPI001CFC453B|nr:uncharacterized protein LOC123208524 [Mangifera indica]